MEEKSLPQCTSGRRAIPYDFVRSSLFNIANHKTPREFLKEHYLCTFGNTKILYSGEELRQDDEDVWMQIIHIAAKNKTLEVEISPYSFLKQLGWPPKVQYKEKLIKSLSRLVATNLSITNSNLTEGVSLSLIRKFFWKDGEDKAMKSWRIVVESELVKLFENYTFVKLFWDHRQKLKPLAKWLHAYYSSHVEPYPVKVQTFHKTTGSKTKLLKHFKENLRKALIELVQVGFLEDFWIDPENRVFVSKKHKPKKFFDYSKI